MYDSLSSHLASPDLQHRLRMVPLDVTSRAVALVEPAQGHAWNLPAMPPQDGKLEMPPVKPMLDDTTPFRIIQ